MTIMAVRLREIAHGCGAHASEVRAMAQELLRLRDEVVALKVAATCCPHCRQTPDKCSASRCGNRR